MTFFQGIFTKNFLEPEKVAIRRSRTTALLRTLIHVMPIGVAIFEIVLNLKGHFVGNIFDKQSYLQFAAKAHEIAMHASIATILLSYIRYQISTGAGMPFGAVLDGLQFLQISYLWSVELWSSILSKDFQLRKKACFAVLIVICITVAATADPSSASLLIPRQGLSPRPSTYLSVNASFLDVWPDRLDDEKIGKSCAMVRSDSLDDAARCPISGLYYFLLLQADGSALNTSPGSLTRFQIQRSNDEPQRFITSSSCQTSRKDQLCASVPQDQLMSGYLSILSNNLKRTHNDAYQFLHKNYYQTYTIASCVTDTVKDTSDQTLLRFARISETHSELERDREIVSIPGLTKGQVINNVSGDNSSLRVDWVHLSMNVFKYWYPWSCYCEFSRPAWFTVWHNHMHS